MSYTATCRNCASTYALGADDLQPLSRVEQMICAKEGLDFAAMVKVTCTRCGTTALVPRSGLRSVAAQADSAVAPAPFAGSLVGLRNLLRHAFERPQPGVDELRRGIVKSWLENFASNLEDARRAYATGRDASGNPMSRTQLADAVERLCAAYSQNQPGLERLEQVCGSGVKELFLSFVADVRAQRATMVSQSGTDGPSAPIPSEASAGAAAAQPNAPTTARAGAFEDPEADKAAVQLFRYRRAKRTKASTIAIIGAGLLAPAGLLLPFATQTPPKDPPAAIFVACWAIYIGFGYWAFRQWRRGRRMVQDVEVAAKQEGVFYACQCGRPLDEYSALHYTLCVVLFPWGLLSLLFKRKKCRGCGRRYPAYALPPA